MYTLQSLGGARAHLGEGGAKAPAPPPLKCNRYDYLVYHFFNCFFPTPQFPSEYTVGGFKGFSGAICTVKVIRDSAEGERARERRLVILR